MNATIRRTVDTPTRFGTREISRGDEIEVSPATAAELVADGGWKLVQTPAIAPAADVATTTTSPSSTDSAPRSRKR